MAKTSYPIIEVKNLEKQYVDGDIITPVLHDVNLKIDEGEFVAIMGPSGSGKSTLMHILGFLDRQTKGVYLFKGKKAGTLSDDELAVMRKEKVGFVFQFFNLLARSTVLDNVMLPMIYAQVPPDERKKRAEKVLKRVGLGHRLDFLANKISGGEKQRVAIARSLANDPLVIFADEPTGKLDSKSGLEVLKIFQELNKEGHTVIMVTHEIEAAEFAKRIVSFHDGRIVSDIKVKKRRKASFTK